MSLKSKQETRIPRFAESETNFTSDEETDEYWGTVDAIRDDLFISIYEKLLEPFKAVPEVKLTMLKTPELASVPKASI